MTNEEKLMEGFEEWLMEQAGHGVFMGGFSDEEEMAVRAAWKASREALVIRVNSAACHDATAGDVLDAIESSGINWEVEQ